MPQDDGRLPPQDALLPPPQWAACAPRRLRCEVSVKPLQPHLPHPGNNEEQTPTARRPHPPQHATQTGGRKGAVGQVLGSCTCITRGQQGKGEGPLAKRGRCPLGTLQAGKLQEQS